MKESREVLQEALQRTPKEDVIEMLVDLVDATDAGAPYHRDQFNEDYATCCSCNAEAPDNLPSYVSPDGDDASLAVYMDDPDNHTQWCSYRVSREILRRLGFHYEPRQVRQAKPVSAEE